MDIKAKLSALWIVVMFNMVFADILGFQMTLMSGNLTPEVQVPEWGMLIFAIILQIPILMIFFSRILEQRASRWANTIAAVITTAFVVLGGSADIVYIFFSGMEILCMALIVFFAWTWPKREGIETTP